MKQKRKGGIFQRFGQWVSGEQQIGVEAARRRHTRNRGWYTGPPLSVTSLPESDNEILLEGDRYVNGKCCRTVGEYKDACQKEYS